MGSEACTLTRSDTRMQKRSLKTKSRGEHFCGGGR